MSYSTTLATAWNTSTNDDNSNNNNNHHLRHTAHPTNLHVSTTPSTSSDSSNNSNHALKRRHPTNSSLSSSIASPLASLSSPETPSPACSSAQGYQQQQQYPPPPPLEQQQQQFTSNNTKARHRTNLSVSSIASTLASSLSSLPTSINSTTVSSPQKKLRPPPAAAATTAFDQGLARIAADVGSSLTLITKKAKTAVLHSSPAPQHSQYSYQALSAYCPGRDEPHLAFSSSSSFSSSPSSFSTSIATSTTTTGSIPGTRTTFPSMGTTSNESSGKRYHHRRRQQQHQQADDEKGRTDHKVLRRASSGTSSSSGASWFGSLRGLVIAGSSASRGAFAPLTMDDRKDRHSDGEYGEDDDGEDDDDDEEEKEEGEARRMDTGPRPSFERTDRSKTETTSSSLGPSSSSSFTTAKGSGFWDREMDEEKYGVASPSSPSPSSSSSVGRLGSWLLPSSTTSILSSIPLPPSSQEGKTYRAPRWSWSMLDPSQFGRTLLTPLYQSVPASAAAADLEEHLEAATIATAAYE